MLLFPPRSEKDLSTRRKLVRAAIVISFATNIACVVGLIIIIAGRGGFAYIKAITTHDRFAKSDPGYAFRTGLFNLSLVTSEARPIVFLGDSLTAEGNWQEFFGGNALILNRGIGGDTSPGVLRRIHQVTALRPRAVFLMIGTNDRQMIGFSPSSTARTEREIISAIRHDSPETRIYIQALLPSKSPKFVAWSDETNRLLAALPDNDSVFFLDFRSRFLENGVMADRLTRDGVHLSPEGYGLWKSALEPTVRALLR